MAKSCTRRRSRRSRRSKGGDTAANAPANAAANAPTNAANKEAANKEAANAANKEAANAPANAPAANAPAAKAVNNSSGGRRKTRKMAKGPSDWNKKVMAVYHELKKKNPATKLGDAMRECSKRKKRGEL